MSASKTKHDIALGILLMGGTGWLIGFVLDSVALMAGAGILGVAIGGLVGWLGARRYLIALCVGALIGTYLGYRSGDRDILIMAAGSGAAIAGFFAAHAELFIGRK